MVGIDIVHVDDIILLSKNQKASSRTFTSKEWSWSKNRGEDFFPSLARTFAVKEAAIKASGMTEGYLRRIEVQRIESLNEEDHRSVVISWPRLEELSVAVSTAFRHPYAIAIVLLGDFAAQLQTAATQELQCLQFSGPSGEFVGRFEP